MDARRPDPLLAIILGSFPADWSVILQGRAPPPSKPSVANCKVGRGSGRGGPCKDPWREWLPNPGWVPAMHHHPNPGPAVGPTWDTSPSPLTPMLATPSGFLFLSLSFRVVPHTTMWAREGPSGSWCPSTGGSPGQETRWNAINHPYALTYQPPQKTLHTPFGLIPKEPGCHLGVCTT